MTEYAVHACNACQHLHALFNLSCSPLREHHVQPLLRSLREGSDLSGVTQPITWMPCMTSVLQDSCCVQSPWFSHRIHLSLMSTVLCGYASTILAPNVDLIFSLKRTYAQFRGKGHSLGVGTSTITAESIFLTIRAKKNRRM